MSGRTSLAQKRHALEGVNNLKNRERTFQVEKRESKSPKAENQLRLFQEKKDEQHS